ncbi:hypothetical protein GLAREA_03848 [Glarea lozoyensis ATCC 20868]|uniref:ER membrane protein complex subunit 7 beta-sandwich domain-containing protein n=1 Tax=Glarea lozoyensis (strain ATCC 20868 / MF5171) TaxID=1116229 RepID=S3DFW9_GLAL2|nr:uncharacterized protein GLAREA_03848 [Glarea lozoyensis ATCC 20868]EPE30881.1 hypothetical protein GLAREA_03848 [Glarea lozoyensis ATCC 20868]
MHISFLLLGLLPLTLATHLRISIPTTPSLANPSLLPPSTHASLTTLLHTYTAPLRIDNTFDFRNVSTGSYLLDIHAHTHVFAPLRVDVRDAGEGVGGGEIVEVWGTFRGNEWDNKGPVVEVQVLEGGVRWFGVRCVGGKEYLLERSGFSPLSLFKNPMILIAGASMLLVFGMPYLMDNMDPELRAEFEERQKSSPLSGNQAANPLQNFDAAAWLAGSSGSGTSTPKKNAITEKGVTR